MLRENIERVPELTNAGILIVDDDEKNLMALRELLSRPGHDIVTARSGGEALQHARECDFAVILLDVHMPGMDGFLVSEAIRGIPRSRHTPIIFITGAHDDPEFVLRGYQAGAVDYVVKPVIPDVLRCKVSTFIELYRNNRALTRQIAEREGVEASLRESQEALRDLAIRLESVREEEQSRIAREIHDELGQALTALKMDVTWLNRRLPAGEEPLMEKTAKMSGLIDETIRAVRRIALGLHPSMLAEGDLLGAIDWYAREFQMRTGLRCRIDFTSNESNDLDLSAPQATALFRICQEALTNIARHAEATSIDISLRSTAHTCEMEIRDNGRGIRERDLRNANSLGLTGMRERAMLVGGKLDIVGERQKGTRVTLSIPRTEVN